MPEESVYKDRRGADDAGPIRVMLGETHAGVGHLLDQVRDMRAEFREDMRRQKEDIERQLRTNKDDLEKELRSIKHDARNHELVVQGRLELADRRSGELERRLGEATAEVKNLSTECAAFNAKLNEATAPIATLLAFRNKVAWGGAIVIGVTTIIWVFVAPVYTAIIERAFGK